MNLERKKRKKLNMTLMRERETNQGAIEQSIVNVICVSLQVNHATWIDHNIGKNKFQLLKDL